MEQAENIGEYSKHNNPYSNRYNLGWKNHPNFSWKNNQPMPYHEQNKPPMERKTTLEEAMEKLANSHASLVKSHEEMRTVHSQLINETRMNFQNQGAQIQSLETQVSQIV